MSLVWLLAVEGLLVGITSKPALHSWLPGGASASSPTAAVLRPASHRCRLVVAYAVAFVAAGARRFVTRDVT